MIRVRSFMLLLLVMMLVCSLSACSEGKGAPVVPENQFSDTPSLPESFGTQDVNRSIIAVYDAVINLDAGTFTVTPVERVGTYHFPLTQLYPNVLTITGYGFVPNFWADIKISHPLPGSIYDGFDPRVIAILPARAGVYFYYPTLGVYANNAVVLEPDGYTKLFDNLGGSITGNVNPFKAYFKNQPYRVWSSTGVTSETQHWNMNLAGFGGPIVYKLVVDVSTNYPNPPQAEIDNAPEPVKIDATTGGDCPLTTDGGRTDITVTLLDWQGQSGIGGVLVEAPDLFNGTVSLAYSAPGPNPNEYVYTGTITNSLLAPEGEYNYLLATMDLATGIYIYNEFTVNVSYISDEGNLIWAKRAGGSALDYGDYGYAITTLSDNSTVVTGFFNGTATFGPGEPNQTVLTGYYDIFIVRYNPDGTLAWAKSAVEPRAPDIGYGITTLSDNSTVVTGNFGFSATFGPGEPNETVLTSAEMGDIFIARYNPNGTLAWAKRAGGASYAIESGYGITTLSDNSTVVTGLFFGSATFGPGETNETVLTSAGGPDIFIARYNPDGTLAWAKRAGGSNDDISESGMGITTLSDNSTVVTGLFGDSATFGPGEPNETVLTSAGDWGMDIFIARYNPDGTLAWAKRAGGSGVWEEGWGITTLSDNSTVVTGYFMESATFGPGESNETILTSAGEEDIFIARYNPDGTLAWAKRAGGPNTDYGDYGSGITTLSDNTIVVTGYFYDSATFGPGELNQTVLTSAGDYDIFIARYNPNGTLSWAKRAGGSGGEGGEGITTLSDNTIVVTGYFYDSATFGPCEPNETVLTSDGGADIFIARYHP